MIHAFDAVIGAATDCILCGAFYSACPREINVTKLINPMKWQIKKCRTARGAQMAEGS
ncbi:MAG: hypothetical protein ACNA71_02405 [Kiritimatiellia bacterium]